MLEFKPMIAFIACFAFSIWLMWHTFSYSPAVGMLISSHVWSDFGAAIPLVRSFSYGANWPPQHPLFPGLPIQYHFLFYLLVGMLEKIGIRIDFALNLPSALGLALLMFLLFRVSSKLFNNIWVGILSVIFFLFNGSFSFLDFLHKYPVASLPGLKDFVSFAPWNDSLVTAFWNLNIYTNQRHLGLSFGLVLLIVHFLLFPGVGAYFVGLILGLLYFTNQAAFAISLLFVGWYFLVSPPLRKRLALSFFWLVLFVPFFKYLALPISSVHYHFGWLARAPVSFYSWFQFWLYNFGLHLFLIPVGILAAPKKAKLLVPPLLLLFLVPNFFQLSVDIINNHKFFNFFLILGVMFSAFALTKLFSVKNLRIFVPIVFISCMAGGIVDLFPIINGYFIPLPDISQNQLANYFYEQVPPQSVVLNSTWFYHPASLAGRKIFNGYSYFTWSYGYSQSDREAETIAIYSSPNKDTACRLLKDSHISYVELSSSPESFLHPNFALWDNEFRPSFSNGGSNVYSVAQNCP